MSTNANTTRNWVIKLVSLYIFSYAAFLILGVINSAFHVGPIHALWAALIFTLATIFVKPIVQKFATETAAGLKAGKTSTVGRVIEYVATYVVALVVWLIVAWLTSAKTGPWYNYLIAPLLLWVAWIVYDLLDETIERAVGKGYDAAAGAIDKK